MGRRTYTKAASPAELKEAKAAVSVWWQKALGAESAREIFEAVFKAKLGESSNHAVKLIDAGDRLLMGVLCESDARKIARDALWSPSGRIAMALYLEAWKTCYDAASEIDSVSHAFEFPFLKIAKEEVILAGARLPLVRLSGV